MFHALCIETSISSMRQRKLLISYELDILSL